MKNILWIFCLSFLVAENPFNWDENGSPIRQGAHIEWWKSIETGNEGEFFVVWSDTRFGIRDIFAQKVTVNGEMLWGGDGDPVALEDGLPDGIPVVLAPGRQEDQIIVSDGAGGFYMIWMDYRDEPDKGDIYGQHVYNDGSLQFDIGGVALSNQPEKQSAPNLCVDNLGGAFAIWKDGSDIRGTHMSFDGDILAPGIGIMINNAPHNRGGVSLEVVADGKAGLAWSREIPINPNENPNSDIVVQVIDTQCNTLLTETSEGGIVICDAPNVQTSPRVTYMDGNHFVVVWQDHRNDDLNSDAYIQFLDTEGNEVFQAGGMNLSDVDGNQNQPRVKADDSGAYIVWQDYRFNADNPDLYIQKVTLDGAVLEENGLRLTAFENSYQGKARLSVDGFGGAFFIWEDYRNGEFPEVDIYAQHLNSNNSFSFEENGITVTTAPFKQQGPVVRKDGIGGVFAGWDDYRDGSNSIYIQHIHPQTGTTLEDGGQAVFKGISGNVGDGETAIRAEAISLGNGNSLVYWLDLRKSPFQSLTYGKIIGSDYSEVDWTNGVPLSLDSLQKKPQVAYLDGTFMVAYNYEGEYTSIYYKLLDENLNMLGGEYGTLLYETDQWNMLNPKITAGEDGSFYMAFIDTRNVHPIANWVTIPAVMLQKFDINGIPQWDDGGILLSDIDQECYLKDIHPLPGGGVMVVWEEIGDLIEVKAQAILPDGTIAEGWQEYGTNLMSNNSQFGWNMQNTHSVKTNDGLFTIWEDTRNVDPYGTSNAGIDLYGQYISFSGEIGSPSQGIAISTSDYDQYEPTISNNPATNQVNTCWADYRNGTDYNIYCNSLNLTDLSINNELLISDDVGSQESPNLISGPGDRYIVVWEDERNDSGDSETLQKDVYLQEIRYSNQVVHPDNGYPLCDMEFAQRNPIILPLDAASDSYLMFWEDLRSTGKEELVNLYAQSISLGSLEIVSNDMLPHTFSIQEVYPNPFNPVATISYSLPERTFIEFDAVNLKGETVSEIFSGYSAAGMSSIEWSPENISSGMYFIRMKVKGDMMDKQKVLLIK